jgi:hypothetical protein
VAAQPGWLAPALVESRHGHHVPSLSESRTQFSYKSFHPAQARMELAAEV